MIENMKAVNNPLTIIAIFAALAEIMGTIALKIVAPELQAIFVWFVMGFPALLVILFFVTLNFNPKVLYAPSDFRDETNFLNTLGGVRQLSGDLSEVQKQLDGATAKIVEDLTTHIGTANQAQMTQLSELVDKRINSIKAQIEKTKESVDVVAGDYYATARRSLGDRYAEKRVLGVFRDGQEVTQTQIARHTGLSAKDINRALRELIAKGTIESRLVIADSGENYSLYKLRNQVGPFQI